MIHILKLVIADTYFKIIIMHETTKKMGVRDKL